MYVLAILVFDKHVCKFVEIYRSVDDTYVISFSCFDKHVCTFVEIEVLMIHMYNSFSCFDKHVCKFVGIYRSVDDTYVLAFHVLITCLYICRNRNLLLVHVF